MQAVARSGKYEGYGGNGEDEEQVKVSILSDATAKEAGEAMLRREAKQCART